MISTMRSKFGPKIIGGIIAVIAGVFIFSGVFLPGNSASGPGVAGEVNGEPISYTDYSRALNQRIEFFKSMMGGKITDEQLAQFKIREAVFQDLAQKKVMSQIAKKEGFYPSYEQIRDHILKMNEFKKDGRFDKVLYKNLLSQNQFTPARFEDLIGQELMEQNFRNFIGSLAHVTVSEVEKSLEAAKNKRKVKYLYVDNETKRKLMGNGKDKDGKDLSLDTFSADLEKKLLPLVGSGADAQVSALLKDPKAKIKVSDWLNETSDMISGVGSIRTAQPAIMALQKSDSAKALPLMGGTLFVKLAETETYNAAKVTAKERTEAYSKIQNEKQNQILGDFMKGWTKNAKITRNDRVVVGGQGGNVPITMDN